MRNAVRILSLSILVALAGTAIGARKQTPAATAQPASQGTTQATVYKDSVAVHQAAQPTSPTLATLSKGSPLEVEKQDGLWFNVKAQPSTVGYVKINEIRLAQAPGGKDDGYSMFSTSHDKTSETAGVRGLDKSAIQSGPMDEQQLEEMQSNRVDDAHASAYANRMHLQRTDVAYRDEPGVGKGHQAPTAESSDQAQAQQQESHAAKVGALSMLGSHFGLGASASTAADALPKSEQEKVDEETYMGPQVAGRMLGAVHIWENPQAQQRVNTIGRWVAMQTPRDDLPWTFAVIDSDEINAFAAPGGYVFMTRGLYNLLQSDDEVAAVVGHEISHVVARDHYNVIHKQAMTSTGISLLSDRIGSHGNPIEQKLGDYFKKQGALVLLTSFDRSVEYRSDMASLIYTARAGYNPLAMYAVMQKLAAVASSSNRLADLYATHPNASDRLDNLDKAGLANVAQYTDRPYVQPYMR